MVSIPTDRLRTARRAVRVIAPGQIDEILDLESRYREDSHARRQPTDRRPGANPRCRACNKYQPYGRSECTCCGYVDGVGYPGR